MSGSSSTRKLATRPIIPPRTIWTSGRGIGNGSIRDTKPLTTTATRRMRTIVTASNDSPHSRCVCHEGHSSGTRPFSLLALATPSCPLRPSQSIKAINRTCLQSCLRWRRARQGKSKPCTRGHLYVRRNIHARWRKPLLSRTPTIANREQRAGFSGGMNSANYGTASTSERSGSECGAFTSKQPASLGVRT